MHKTDSNGDDNHNHILHLHSLGFKLVPISADGFTPTIEWTNVYENGWKQNEITNFHFENIATCFGKTHIRDESNRELYLNCLDIDSDEVFTRLSIIVDEKGNDRFFVNELRKHTFVTRTRKDYGRHIYWFSRAPNPPITSHYCKLNHEFEIKTDKSGLSALPPSRHRVAPEFHYHNVGQNKIMISDRLYGELVRLLDDCLRKRDTYAKNELLDFESRQLEEADISNICRLISPIYLKGHRHHLCFCISGLLYKNGIGIDSTSKIINSIGKEDEELKSRLGVMRYTYTKDRYEVSGRFLLLEMLEAVCVNKRQAVNILTGILKIVKNIEYSGTKEIDHNSVAEDLINEYHFKSMKDNEEVFYYDYKSGKYNIGGEFLIRQQLEILFPSITTHHVSEIVQKIKRKNPIERYEFDSSPFMINLKNGLLDISAGKIAPHSPKYLSCIQLPVTYDSAAKCPLILQFLSEILRPRDIFTFMQFIGYCLIKTSKYEKALILLGKGDNGKSVILKLIAAFLGSENLSHDSLKELCEDKFSKADLFGKLANTCGDLETYRILDTSAFKQLVSGDDIRAQKKHQDPFYFRNHAKLIFSSNHIPVVTESGYSWFKRIILLPFLSTFNEDKDVNKIDELITPFELSGFLNLVLIALKQLIKTGNFAHAEDIRTVQQLFSDNLKFVNEFISYKCVRDSSSCESCSDIYNAYCQYCKGKTIVPLLDNTFGVYLHEMRIEKCRLMVAGVRSYKYRGIKFKNKQS